MADVARHINILHIGGTICAKPVFRISQGTKNNAEGQPVCEFRIAHTSSSKGKDQTDDKTTFLNCELWGSRAETASKAMDVGDLVEINGPILIKTYMKDGVRVYYTKCLVRLIIHNKKIVKQDATAQPQKDDDDTPIKENFVSDAEPDDDDDVPF